MMQYLTNNNILEITNLNHYFGHGKLVTQTLFDINLTIKAGEIVIMTGPSGSGKTTLLTLIGGLRSVQEGSLKFNGQELLGASNEELVQVRRKIGYIFQAHNLLDFAYFLILHQPSTRITQNISF